MKTKPRQTKSRFSTRVDGPYVFITDEGRGPTMTVTNDAENVVESIQEELGHPISEFYLIYKDSMGTIDGIKTKNNKFAGFYSIGAKSFDDAKEKVKENIIEGEK